MTSDDTRNGRTADPTTAPPRAIDPDDPVIVRRARIKKLTDLGSRTGYSCFGLAIVLFFVALMTGFPFVIVMIVITLMAIGSVVLLPAIILGYGVKAADAEDRGEKFGY